MDKARKHGESVTWDLIVLAAWLAISSIIFVADPPSVAVTVRLPLARSGTLCRHVSPCAWPSRESPHASRP